MGRQVLISPYALTGVVKEKRHITLNLTKQQIESSPSLSSDKPVSQQFKLDYHGYHIHATDGELGHIEDFIIDDKTWAIRYLIIDTRNGLPGRKILLTSQWIDHMSWSESKVFMNLPCETIRQAPAYTTEESLPSRDYETSLHQHYNRPIYWAGKSTAKEHVC